MLDFDATRTYRTVQAKLDETKNPRHRKMLEMLLQHSRGEVEGDLEAVLGSLAPYPIYRGVRKGGPDAQPRGMDQVREFYVNDIFGGGRHVLESVKTRITIDDNTIITEGTIRVFQWGRDLERQGTKMEDPDAAYLLTTPLLIVWPYDSEGRIIGEESWVQEMIEPLRKVADVDVPANFKAYIAGKRAKLGM